MTANTPPEALLAHTGWMRRLALTLVRDDAQADDVVQDAVAAALRSPPRDPVALPAWLATSVRNAAKQLWRGEGRRAAREKASARAEATPGAAEVVARAEEHGLVVQAVLGLDEPHRSALLLRFYDDLPPREVAARLGVPVETARARIRRGLEVLRGRLDAMHGGDGGAWKLALVPLTLPQGLPSAAGAGSGAAAGAKSTTGAMVMAGTGATVGVGVVALAVGFGAGWLLIGKRAEEDSAASAAAAAKAGARVKLLEDQVAASDGDAKRIRSQKEQLDAEYAKAMKEAERVGAERDALAAEVERLRAAAAASGATPAPPAKKGPRFVFAEFAKLESVDWKSVGEHLSAISPLCGTIAEKIAKGEPFMAEQGKAAQHNGFLINAALKIADQVPGTGVNGAFTHPAFQVNAIAAALEAANMPLTPEQTTAMEKTAREFCDEDARRLTAYDDTTFGMRKLIDEADLRRRFFEAAFAILTKEQRDTLTPPGTKGLIGLDLYSEGLLWATVMRPLPFKDPAALTETVANAVRSGMRTGKDSDDAIRAIVAEWQRDLPAEIVQSGQPQKPGSLQASIVALAATKTLQLSERVVTGLKLEGPAAATARRWAVVLVPMPSAADDE